MRLSILFIQKRRVIRREWTSSLLSFIIKWAQRYREGKPWEGKPRED